MVRYFTVILVLTVIVAGCFLILPRLTLELMPDADDSAEYYLRAVGLSRGLGYVALEDASGNSFLTFTTPPLLPHVLSPFIKICGENISRIKFVFYLIELGSLFGIYYLFRCFLKRHESIILTVLLVISPEVLRSTSYLMTDLINLGLAGFILAVLLKYCAAEDRKHLYHWFLIGFGFGALFWMRLGNIGWVAAASCWMLVRALMIVKDKRSWSELAMVSGGSLVAALMLVVWIWSQDPNFFTDYFNWHANYKIAEVSQLSFSEKIFSYDYFLLKFMLYISHLFVNDYPLLKEILLILMVPLWFSITEFKKSTWKPAIYVFILVGAMPYVASSAHNYRYGLPTMMLLLIIAPLGYSSLTKVIRTSKHLFKFFKRVNLNHIFIYSLLIWFIILGAPDTRALYRDGLESFFPEDRLEARETLTLIRNELPEDAVILSTLTDYRVVTAYSNYSSLRGSNNPGLNSSLEQMTSFMVKFEHPCLFANDSLMAADTCFTANDLLSLNRNTNVLLELKKRSFPQADYVINKLSAQSLKVLEADQSSNLNSLDSATTEIKLLAEEVTQILKEGFRDEQFYQHGTVWKFYWLTPTLGRYFLRFKLWSLWFNSRGAQSTFSNNQTHLYGLPDRWQDRIPSETNPN